VREVNERDYYEGTHVHYIQSEADNYELMAKPH